jgi:hypothetical protein
VNRCALSLSTECERKEPGKFAQAAPLPDFDGDVNTAAAYSARWDSELISAGVQPRNYEKSKLLPPLSPRWRCPGDTQMKRDDLPVDPKRPDKHRDPATGIWPMSEWGAECYRGFVSSSMFGSGQVIKRTNRDVSRKWRRTETPKP